MEVWGPAVSHPAHPPSGRSGQTGSRVSVCLELTSSVGIGDLAGNAGRKRLCFFVLDKDKGISPQKPLALRGAPAEQGREGQVRMGLSASRNPAVPEADRDFRFRSSPPSTPAHLGPFLPLEGEGLRGSGLEPKRTMSSEGGSVSQLTAHRVARVAVDRIMEK